MKITVTHQNVKVEITEENASSYTGAQCATDRVCQILREIAHQIRFINENNKEPKTWTNH